MIQLALILAAMMNCSRGCGMYDQRLGGCPTCGTTIYRPRA
ncbi:hypothetical protein ABZ635_22205 [Nocardiopsis sp. NPDC007018]